MIDAKLTDDFGTRFTERGDVDVVTGADAVRQRILVGLREGIRLTAPPPTPAEIEAQRSRIEQTVRRIDATEEPITVTVANTPQERGGTVRYEITTTRVEIDLTVGEEG